ncbi:MAG: hypothetical protein IJS32_09810 [Kiritimatiellae bacterium]|nr:hypothetical protein [Kiritimatiellia bacterium]
MSRTGREEHAGKAVTAAGAPLYKRRKIPSVPESRTPEAAMPVESACPSPVQSPAPPSAKGAVKRAAALFLWGTFTGVAVGWLFIGAAGATGKCRVWPGDGRWIPAETGPHAEWMPFLQGGTDWGGGMAYALEAMAGVCYLALASWSLALWMARERKRAPDGAGWGKRTRRALWFFAPYFLLLGVGWIWGLALGGRGGRWCSCEADDGVLRMTVALVGVLTAAWTAWLDGRRWRLVWKLLPAPAAVALWVFLAWDGQTPRAGQRLWSGQEPLPAVRSRRHAAMLAWYGLWVERPKTGGDDAFLWFWTDGQSEFGTRLADSPSARALRTRSDLPWTGGKAVFAVPLAPERGMEVRKAMPYATATRHNGGYFLQTPEGMLCLRQGAIETSPWMGRPWYPMEWRDVHLAAGCPYWTVFVTVKGVEDVQLRRVGDENARPCRWREVLEGERIPVQVLVWEDAPFGALADCLQELDATGFREVFVTQVRWR